ncbi:MAG: hypothetical protein JWN01_478 [Patescibacteria group bacterium]|nr:hypothetical protein [Patescibacteria group bacterium]
MALINPNSYIRQFRDFEDKLSDGITAFAGNIKFVYFHTLWFGLWIAANLGLLGASYMFDKFPFGLLTMVVSLEAIFLSTFVMISQNRSAEKAEIRAQLDYETDLQAEKEIAVIMKTLIRLAEKQGVDITDLATEMDDAHHLAKREADRRTEARHKRARARR